MPAPLSAGGGGATATRAPPDEIRVRIGRSPAGLAWRSATGVCLTRMAGSAPRGHLHNRRQLGAYIVLIHHTDCGMLTFKDDELKAQIEADTGLRPPFALEAFAELEADVRQSIRRIQSSPFVPHKDQIRGFVYDVETGRLNEVEP